MIKLKIYNAIDELSASLDALCWRYPDIYPDNTFRKHRYNLAVDVASFQNKIGAAFIPKMQSALFGTFDRLRKYGVR